MPQIDFTFIFVCFGLSVAAGAILGIIYSFFKLIRIIYQSVTATVISDILFMILFTVITLVFSIGFTDGFVRYYVLAGEFLGFYLSKIALGKMIDKILILILKIIKKSVYYVKKFFVGFIKKLLKARDNMLYNKENKNHTCMKKKGRRT